MISAVQEHNYGLYAWKLLDGTYFGDSDDNILCIASKEGDFEKIKELAAAAKYYNADPGYPTFMPGARKVSDSEREIQVERMLAGLIPDEYDYAAILEQVNSSRNDK